MCDLSNNRSLPLSTSFGRSECNVRIYLCMMKNWWSSGHKNVLLISGTLSITENLKVLRKLKFVFLSSTCYEFTLQSPVPFQKSSDRWTLLHWESLLRIKLHIFFLKLITHCASFTFFLFFSFVCFCSVTFSGVLLWKINTISHSFSVLIGICFP